MRLYILVPVFAVSIGVLFCPTAAAQKVPVVGTIPAASAPPVPSGLVVTCFVGPNTLTSSPTCPVLLRNGYVYWAYSYSDNRDGMAIVAYDQSTGALVKRWDQRGARYVWQITSNPAAQNVVFSGQSNLTITMSWNALYLPPPAKGTWALGKVVNNTDKHVMLSFHVPKFDSADAEALKNMTMAGVLIEDYGILSIDPRGNTSGCADPVWRAEIRFADRTWSFVYNVGTTLDITIDPDRQFVFTPGRGGQVVSANQPVTCVKK